jgi:thiamine biosynthesis lipoprotein ApbE
MPRRFSIFLFCVLAACGCSTQPALKTVTLPSGKIVRVISVMPIHFSSGETSLMLKYQTDLKVSDRDALRKEVDEIWSSFQTDANNARVQSAIVSANEVPQGAIIKSGQAFNFVYKKNADGTWQLQ